MKKLSVIAGFLAVVVVAAVAIAGVTVPVLLLDGNVKKGTVPVVKSYNNVEGFDFYYRWSESNEITIDPKHWASRPVAEGTVPTARDGLLNPNKPVSVMVPSESMTFNFDYYNYYGDNGRLKMRVLDSNGRTLGTVVCRKDQNGDDVGIPLKLKLTNKTQRYYVETYDPEGRKERYCYLLVEVERDDAAINRLRQQNQYMRQAQQSEQKMQQMMQDPLYSRFYSKPDSERIKFGEEMVKYIDQHGGNRMTTKDLQAIVNNTNKALGYKAFDMEDVAFMTQQMNQGGQPQSTPKSTPAKKSTTTKAKRTKKSK